MDKKLVSFLEAQADEMAAFIDEYDLGFEFVEKEAESVAGNDHADAYVGGMVEGAITAMLHRADADDRLETVAEMQRLVLDVYKAIEEGADGEVA